MRRVRAATTAVVAAGTTAAVVAALSLTGPDPTDVDVRPVGTTSATPSPTAPPTASPTTPSSPAPDPSSPPVATRTPSAGSLLAGHLLRAEDLEPIGNTGWTWEERPGTLPRCTPTTAERAVETATVRFVVADNSFYVVAQGAEVHASEAAASARLDELRAGIGACATASTDVDLFYGFTLTGVGDRAFITETYEDPVELGLVAPGEVVDAALYTTTRVARTGRVVTWTLSTVGKQEYLYFPEVAELGPAVDSLCGPAGGACTNDAQLLVISYPPERAGTEVEPGACDGDVIECGLPGPS